jgi:uncharacterized damage-inducible protein DinB
VSTGGVQQLLYVMDEAFSGHHEHALLANLRTLRDEDWHQPPPGGGRSVFDIVRHVIECKYAYQDHAFGEGSMRWDRPGSVPTIEPHMPPAQVIDRLEDGQRALRESVATLQDDAELTAFRRAPWGKEYETRWLINVMVQHDLYHGGEVNHIRALRQENDKWAWELDR